MALDTTLPNKAARSLYASAGFDEVAYRPPARGLPGFVALVKPLQLSVDHLAQRLHHPLHLALASARGKNGSASERRATSSQTGNSPSRWPKRSR